ncbi:MAG TPA: glycosyltransferase [Burkholderiales bacterium]|nr:glycosyltransferase [Burkholderiales bacterium]
MKPRVLLLGQEVHPIPPDKGAAVEQWIDAVAHRLEHYEPHIVSVPHHVRPDSEVEGNVHYRRIRIGRFYNRIFRKLTRLDPYSYVDRIVRYAGSIAPAIVHIHNAPRLVDRLAGRIRGARIVLHMHNEKEDRVRNRIDALIGCSDYIRNWFSVRGFPADRYGVLANGVDTHLFRPLQSPDAARELRRKANIPLDRFVVLFVGRISPEKGPDLLAEAARWLDPSRFHFLFVGEWSRGDAETSARVRYARQLEEQLRVVPHAVLDTLAPSSMHSVYGLGDLVVIPSRFEEPFSMVAIEAMACGVPVLALRRGGMAEYLVDGENALVLDPDTSAQELAHSIDDAAQNPSGLAEMAARARGMVERRFTWDRVAAETERFYDSLLGQQQGLRPKEAAK